MARTFLMLFLALSPLVGQGQQVTLNLVTLGDSLTEGVPHLNGEHDTYPLW